MAFVLQRHSGSAKIYALVRRALLAAVCVLPVAAVAASTPQPPGKVYKLSLPPSADLRYQVTARQSGLSIDGTAQVQWKWADGKFSVDTESRAALFGKVFDAKSVGDIDTFGLAPATFVDKRMRKSATTTTFDRQSKTIRFSASSAAYPIKGGEQDRNSVVWQLIGVARGAGPTFKAGSTWRFFVAGQRDAELWTFNVGKPARIRTAMGVINAIHVVRAPPADSKGQKLDIWLAPTLQWYPAKLRFTEADGDFIEQTLETIDKL
ncbi:MAG: DUF3108 domain-containing protein [Pseudomonadota bacterium]